MEVRRIYTARNDLSAVIQNITCPMFSLKSVKRKLFYYIYF